MLFILGKKMMTYNRIGPAHNSGLLKFYLYRCNSLSWPLFHSITAAHKFQSLKRARVTIAHGMNIISIVKHKKLDVDVTFWLFFVKNVTNHPNFCLFQFCDRKFHIFLIATFCLFFTVDTVFYCCNQETKSLGPRSLGPNKGIKHIFPNIFVKNYHLIVVEGSFEAYYYGGFNFRILISESYTFWGLNPNYHIWVCGTSNTFF